jgi:hypothetical protein
VNYVPDFRCPDQGHSNAGSGSEFGIPGPVSAEECNNLLSVVFLIRIRIDLALLDPDPGAGNLPKLTNKPDFQPFKKAFVQM